MTIHEIKAGIGTRRQAPVTTRRLPPIEDMFEDIDLDGDNDFLDIVPPTVKETVQNAVALRNTSAVSFPVVEQMRIGPEFFVKERLDMYDRWLEAFFRELVQNATDRLVQSSYITIDISEDGDYTRITFADDGVGMDENTLRNVYFLLGATTKNGEGSVGGFGRARILTCFSAEKYEIHTQDNMVSGSGAMYSIVKGEYYYGCKLVIWFKKKEASVEDMTCACQEYLKFSWLRYWDVYLNGERFRDWLHCGKLTRELLSEDRVFARLFVNKSAANCNLGYICVRVNGAMMYRQPTSNKVSILVEILPEINREVLVANRDDMHWQYRRVLLSFIEELAVDTVSALRERKRRSFKYSSNGNTTVSPSRIDSDLGIRQAKNRLLGDFFSQIQTVSQSFQAALNGSTGMRYTGDYLSVEEVSHVFPFDVYAIDRTTEDQGNVVAVIPSYNPNCWGKGQNRNNPEINNGSRKMKLLFIWYILVKYVLEIYCTCNDTTVEMTVGWVFGTMEASHEQEDSYSPHVFLLNPVNDDGKMRYSIRDEEDILSLLALAVHEVVHVAYSGHNEDFTRMEIALWKRVRQSHAKALVMKYLNS